MELGSKIERKNIFDKVPKEEKILFFTNDEKGHNLFLTNEAIYYNKAIYDKSCSKYKYSFQRLKYSSILSHHYSFSSFKTFKSYFLIITIKRNDKEETIRIELQNFSNNHLFDSILHNYRDNESNINYIYRKLNLRNTGEILLSIEKQNKLSLRKKRLIYQNMVFILLFLFHIWLSFYLTVLFGEENNIVGGYITIVGLFLIILIWGSIMVLKDGLKVLNNQKIENNSIIHLTENGIVIVKEGNKKTINFYKNFKVETFLINKSIKKHQGKDSLKIITPKKEIIIIGPLDNCGLWFNLVMINFMEWKLREGIIYSKKGFLKSRLILSRNLIKVVKQEGIPRHILQLIVGNGEGMSQDEIFTSFQNHPKRKLDEIKNGNRKSFFFNDLELFIELCPKKDFFYGSNNNYYRSSTAEYPLIVLNLIHNRTNKTKTFYLNSQFNPNRLTTVKGYLIQNNIHTTLDVKSHSWGPRTKLLTKSTEFQIDPNSIILFYYYFGIYYSNFEESNKYQINFLISDNEINKYEMELNGIKLQFSLDILKKFDDYWRLNIVDL
ncbi:MAG: hypothetical protein JXA99_15540 [Candidatus Lokiarchaeota archaeon]|nr:hypothetical protein [Candidatus Lokiarchaeota archaeon]